MRDLPRLYAVTDEAVVPNGVLVSRVEKLLAAGLRLLQVRFKTTPREERVRLGRALRAATRDAGAILIANDSPELAREIDADGVHLGAEDPAVANARGILGSDAIIGVTGYADEQRVARWGPDEVAYLGLSSPHPSPTKEKPVPDAGEFVRLVARARVPVYAIGGMTPERTPDAIRAGCHGVAAVSCLLGPDGGAEEVRRFLEAL